MKKSKSDTVSELKKQLLAIETVYKSNCVNWAGETIDTKEYFTEIIANELLKEKCEFEKIATITRAASYFSSNHSKIVLSTKDSNRNEEIFAKRIMGLELSGLGTIWDFQIPLKNSLKDKGLGKIDLLSFNANNMTMFLIELKNTGNKETLLRATLEIYTYYKQIDKPKIVDDFLLLMKSRKNANTSLYNPNNIIVKPVVLVVPGCQAYKELNQIHSGKRPKLKALSQSLDIKYYVVRIKSTEIDLDKF